jgi:hypothetical protein
MDGSFLEALELDAARVIDAQPSAPTVPRPAAYAGASSRSIPNDLNKAKPLANASRRRGSL